MIIFDENSKIFYLATKKTSYSFRVLQDDYLTHLYWGKKIAPEFNVDNYFTLGTRNSSSADLSPYTSDTLPSEYPTYGSADLRTPALDVTFADGSNSCHLSYVDYKIEKGKQGLDGMPAVYCEDGDKVETLTVTLCDKVKDLYVYLSYSVFEDYDVITRSAKIENRGETVKLHSALSAAVDTPDGRGYDFLHLDGCWGRENGVARQPLFCGKQCVDSKRGSSSHRHNPFLCIPSHNATETVGDVYSMSLIYSGNFEVGVELDQFDTARAYAGINPFGFGYTLNNGEFFQTPEAVLVYSANGLGEMSRTYHKLYRERLARGKFRNVERYALINNWEATYFNFTEEKLLAIADKAVAMGLDLLVLDDGWFGVRNDDHRSLGDWYLNKEKLPHGLAWLASEINKKGLKFGLWFEPEMVSPDSDLYRAHPDWALHIEGRQSSKGRNQLVLDLSREDVCDYIIEAVSNVLKSANIEYVKWDYNRNFSEVGSALLPADRQCEVPYRYIKGLYRVLETVTSRFPNVLFESCASGGGRFDPGMFYYMPQAWTSDDSDAIERLFIQYGTSLCYPYNFMGAHVSAVPNHQIGRVTPLATRINAALPGQFGFELDASKMTDEEVEASKKAVEAYRELGPVFHRGDLYRLVSPYESNFVAHNFVSEDGKTVILQIFTVKSHLGAEFKFVKLQGLEADAVYIERETKKEYRGDFLMNIGLNWWFKKDFESQMFVFDRK